MRKNNRYIIEQQKKNILFFLWLLLSCAVYASYIPVGNGIVCTNGTNRFTRAIYGTNTAFRFETSDFPEIGMYMPNLGGSMYFALSKGNTYKWIRQADFIESTYIAGKRTYLIKDKEILGDGELDITFLALADADGMVAKIEPKRVSSNVKLIAVYGGANNEHFRREGDLGADRVDCFYIKPKNCLGNEFRLQKKQFNLTYGDAHKKLLSGVFSTEASFHLSEASGVDNLISLLQPTPDAKNPLLVTTVSITQKVYFSLLNPETISLPVMNNLEAVFELAEQHRLSIANKVKIDTPDQFLNPVGGNLAVAADAVWQSPVYHHGSIGWRIPLLGWRHCYIGDCLGWKDRARSHFDYYASLQLKELPDKPVIMDSLQEKARAAYVIGTPMYSSGYIANCQENELYFYDMNLVYIDALLWHLNWTGDLEYAKKMWSVLERHLDWEKRTFDPDNDGLYDAVCCIWASDALQYSSGAVTHSSAYNYRANKMAAMIAEKIGKDSSKYKAEASKIFNAINDTLWLKDKGWWAEYKGTIKNRQLHESAAAWTVYHAIDSELSEDNLQGYQAGRYIIKGLPHIPVLNEQGRPTGFHVVSTTNWMPYEWSVNNVAFAETVHTALALFQVGMNEEAYRLMKGSILDVMYQGKSPGNFGMTTSYDAVGEVYRDFSDGVGIFSRLLVQGLFGISPDALNGKINITPGFPASWNEATIETSDIRFSFLRKGNSDQYIIHQKGEESRRMVLRIPALNDKVLSVRVNGKQCRGRYINYVGKPLFEVECTPLEKTVVEITWGGIPVNHTRQFLQVAQNDWCDIYLEKNQQLKKIVDPQQVLAAVKVSSNAIGGKVVGALGSRTFFVEVKQGDAIWTMPIEMEVVPSFEIENFHQETSVLSFILKNNSRQKRSFSYAINGKVIGKMDLSPLSESEKIEVQAPIAVMGTNRVGVLFDDYSIFEGKVINWMVQNDIASSYRTIDMKGVWNDAVTQIFKNQYLTPRSPYSTLQIPIDGYGDWCVPLRRPDIDDSGLRGKVQDGIFHTPMGIPFATSDLSIENNIVYTSLWNNYPDSISVALTGKASHLYLLMAGSTNHMQSRFVNGSVIVHYQDGSTEQLDLINPESWVPIEQDYYIDEYAYKVGEPRPYRVLLKEGIVSRDLTKDKKMTAKVKRMIDGGAGVILDIPLSPQKELRCLTLQTKAYEVIIGMMAGTLKL